MTIKEFFRPTRDRFSFRHLSIQKRLPLLMCLLLLLIMSIFTWTSYNGVKNAAMEAGRERLGNLSTQLSSMFGQSAKNITAATHATAQNETVKKYLVSGGPDTAVLKIFKSLQTDSTWVLTELVNRNRLTVLHRGLKELDKKPVFDTILSSYIPRAPDSCQVGKMYMVGDTIYYPVIAAITVDGQVDGWLVRWKLQLATSKAVEQFSQILGGNANFYLGNTDRSLWTNLVKRISSPVADSLSPGIFAEYNHPGNNLFIATMQPIPNTEWLMLIEFSQASILKPASLFFKWLVITGCLLLLVGILLAWTISRNISGPLKKLTDAATAVAGGDYSVKVETNSHDELGKLAQAFNTMSVQVEKKVLERTSQLQKANRELEAFSYSVSHDLRAPLRAISGFAAILNEDYGPALDEEAKRLTGKIVRNATMMGQLIDDLISFSKTGKQEIKYKAVNMRMLAEACMEELLSQVPVNNYQVDIGSLPDCYGDEALIRQVWMNLISNALKYSSKKESPRVEIGGEQQGQLPVYFIRDNGVGFDMQYVHKLFGVFQRLHSQGEFEGTGVGLALAKRIVNRHNGDIWAKSSPGDGAGFYFSLPNINSYE